ncbi:MAG: glycoside hydrolase family 43 protein [Mobilitalea sp.]
MKTEEINIRDPYILEYQGKYYLYGTRSSTAWGLADGFDCYVSEDLKNWSEPIEIFHKYQGFWADRNYWAPECHYYEGEFYLFASFKAEGRHLGIQILKSSDPTGPFTTHSDGPVTPLDWECLDGTLYLDLDGIPHLIFSHSFSQHPNGAMCELELTSDLSAASGSPKLLFEATDAAWAIPFPYGEIEFGIKGDMYFSDGPFLHRLNSGRLALLWSSWSKNGYAMGIAYSDNDEINGKWLHEETPIYGKDGGHGMIFNTPEEKLMLTLHYPNEKTQEKPIFIELEEKNDCLVMKK